jgi:hypothetical protein
MLFGQSHNVQFRSATSIVGDVTITAITPAIEGTESNPNGTDGSFAFTVSLNKGATTLTTIATAGVIVATPHIPTDLNSLQVKSLKAYVQQGILNVSGLSAGKSWSVYSVFGVRVYQGVAKNDVEILSATTLSNRGVYLINSGDETIKVVY